MQIAKTTLETVDDLTLSRVLVKNPLSGKYLLIEVSRPGEETLVLAQEEEKPMLTGGSFQTKQEVSFLINPDTGSCSGAYYSHRSRGYLTLTLTRDNQATVGQSYTEKEEAFQAIFDTVEA